MACGCTLGRMSDPTTPTQEPTLGQLAALYRRAEKIWLERLVRAGETGQGGEKEAGVLVALTQARSHSRSAGG
jgi:hypothetical protein